MSDRRREGALVTGVYGSGKSSVAEEMAYLLEQRGGRYALLDLDYLSWARPDACAHANEFDLLLQNLAVVAANYQRAGVGLFVLAYLAEAPARCRASSRR